MCKWQLHYEEKFEACEIEKKFGKEFKLNDEYCIFHAPNDQKDKDLFWEKFKKIIELFKSKDIDKWNFNGFIFPDENNRLNAIQKLENVEISLIKAIFAGGLGFEKGKELFSVDFSGSEFHRGVLFNRVIFKGAVSFKDAIFIKGADFKETKFLEENSDIIFDRAKFKDGVNFNGAIFKGGVNFTNCEFCKTTTLGRVTYHGNAIFNNAQFNGVTYFDFAQFKKYLEFKDAILQEEAESISFKEAKFCGSSDFTGSKFLCKVDFEKAEFLGLSGVTLFNKVLFNNIVYFKGTRFSGSARFEEAEFKSSAFFYDSPIFINEAHFENAKFHGRADFSHANFLGQTFFKWAIFEKEVFYSNATLMEVHFDATIFQGPVYFTGSFINLLRFDRTIFSIQPSFFSMQISGSKNAEIKYLICDSNIEFLNGFIEKTNDGVIEHPCIIKLTECSLGGNLLIRAMLNNIEINDCTFKAIVNIEPRNLEYKTNVKIINSNFLSDSILSNVEISELKNCIITNLLVVKNSLLCRAVLEGTVDLRKIDFINVTWSKINRKRHFKCIKSLQNISVIYDELIKIHGKPEDYEKIDLCNNAVKSRKMCKKEINNKEKQMDIINIEEMYRAIASSYESRARYGSSGPFKVGEFDLRKYRKKDVSRLERIVIKTYRLFASYGESIWKTIAGILITAFIPTFIYLLSGDYCFQQSLYYSLKGCFSFGSEIVGQSGEFLTFIPFIQKLSLILFIPLFLFALRRKVKR